MISDKKSVVIYILFIGDFFLANVQFKCNALSDIEKWPIGLCYNKDVLSLC